MFKYDKCNMKLIDEMLKFVELFKDSENKDIVIPNSYLDCFVSLINDWKNSVNDYNAVIVNRKGHRNKDDTYSMTFATNCIKPHWNSEGVMFTSGVWDATKFPLDYEDLWLFLKYIKNSKLTGDFDVLLLPKSVSGNNENWGKESVRGNFDTTGVFNKVQLR